MFHDNLGRYLHPGVNTGLPEIHFPQASDACSKIFSDIILGF